METGCARSQIPCPSAQSTWLVHCVLRVLQKQYTDPDLCVLLVAESVGRSREHVSRLFTSTVGTSPQKYLRRMRIVHALRCLGMGSWVSSAARACGYRDANTFRRAFKAETGIAPSLWRQQAATIAFSTDLPSIESNAE